MAPETDETFMQQATPEQEKAWTILMAALDAVKLALHELTEARDLLNRETPAREVAIAITEVEGGELRIGKALSVLTSEFVFSPPRMPEGDVQEAKP